MRPAVFEASRVPIRPLSFLRHAYRIEIGEAGLLWTLESRLFGRSVRRVVLMDLPWDDIEKLEPGPVSAAYTTVRVHPSKIGRLLRPIGKYGPIKTRLRLAEDGSALLVVFGPGDANDVLKMCSRFAAKTAVECTI